MHLGVILAILIGYVLVFNSVARAYFDSDFTMSWHDLYRKLVPALKIHIET